MTDFQVPQGDYHQAEYGLMAMLNSQQVWSHQAFGGKDQRDGSGPLEHLKKEIEEYKATGCKDIEELADCYLLLLDATWRDGHYPDDLAKAIFDKMVKNSKRTWPSQPDKDGVFEHVSEAA